MKILIAGNKEYGLSKSLYNLYPDATFLSRTTGYNFKNKEIRQQVADMSLNYDVFLSVSGALGDFVQTLLVQDILQRWIEHNHKGYLIALGSSADTPVKGTENVYPVEKRALRAYCRQLSQRIGGETPPSWKVTYLSPGNLHTPKQDEKLPDVLKLDTEYVAKLISWLLEQPRNINISELCLDRIRIL